MAMASVLIGIVWDGPGRPEFEDLEKPLRSLIVDLVGGEAWRVEIEPARRKADDPPHLTRVRARGPVEVIVDLAREFESQEVTADWYAVD